MITILAQVKPITNPVVSGLVGKTEADAPGILAKFFSGLVGILLVLATIWAFFNLLLGAFNWISSGGDKSKLESAQQKIIHSIIGLFLVFASWAIFLVLLRFLGLTGPGGELKLALPKLF